MDPQFGDIKGLKNNIYEFNSQNEYVKQKITEIENNLQKKQNNWHAKNLDKWYKSTPQIYDYHKDADLKLHKIGKNQAYVNVKRVPPKLPQIKEIITPFLTEAIDEEINEKEVFQNILNDNFANQNDQ